MAKIGSLHQSGMIEENKIHLIILKVVLMHQFVLTIEDINCFYLLIFYIDKTKQMYKELHPKKQKFEFEHY